MTALALSSLGAGFSNPSIGSQAVFRAALQALSHPGRVVDLPHDAETPACGRAASAALLLALLDADCRLWLSPSLAASEAAGWLRFHTGCVLVDSPAEAQFAWVAEGDDRPALGAFSAGTDAYPDQSTTCVLDVTGLHQPAGGGWALSGPGIRGTSRLAVEGRGLGAFASEWQDNHATFPQGVDVYLATEHQIVGLPRSTFIEQET